MTVPKKLTLSALPVAHPSQLLIHNLTADTHTPTVDTFRKNVLVNTPSLQRRARLLSPECHFSHVAPFPMPFPYEINPPADQEADENKGTYIEKWLSEREAVHERPISPDAPNATLRKCYPKNRDQPLDLVGIAETTLRDCLPHLDVGDAFTILGAPSLANEFEDEGDGKPSNIQEVVDARQELVDILSGHAMLISPEGDSPGFAPWSLRYSGHQFGSWAGQLGDGRAMSILTTPHPSDSKLTYELQLKGAGRTPFSRSADGLAVLRSSIREYLCSEAMQALGIPTTRALSLVSLPALPVTRERMETACVLTRIAPSFIRIGNFEAVNGVTNMFFFGGGQQKPHYDALRILGEWVVKNVLKLDIKEGSPWGKELVMEVARRNGKMVAAWQAYGFMHGVINTDNVSILGLTIDYGPYAFMDVYDALHVCNHTDETGRYSYKAQPSMIVYALRALLDALAPLIGAETDSGRAVLNNWADVAPEKLAEWKAKGLELRNEVDRLVEETTSVEYGNLMRKRLGLRRSEPNDNSKLFSTLLDLMSTFSLDFHTTFRNLVSFRPELMHTVTSTSTSDLDEKLHAFISKLLSATPEPEKIDVGAGTQAWLAWLETYGARIESEREKDNSHWEKEREKEMRNANPRFVLRQWVLEEVIGKVERDAISGRRVLAKVMHMACNPFEPWGAEDNDTLVEDLGKEEKEERRYCGLGDKRLLGFQCSCSS